MNKFFCEQCGAEVPGNATRCPECGVSFDRVKCPRCGFIGKESRFSKGCPSCGYLASDSLPGVDLAGEMRGSGVPLFGSEESKEKQKDTSVYRVSDKFYIIAGIILSVILVSLIVVLFSS